MKKILFMGAMLCVLHAAEAGVLKDGYIMCTSEQALGDAATLASQGKTSLLKSIGCFPTQSNIEGAVLDRGFMTSKVILRFVSGDTAVVYIPSEALGSGK